MGGIWDWQRWFLVSIVKFERCRSDFGDWKVFFWRFGNDFWENGFERFGSDFEKCENGKVE